MSDVHSLGSASPNRPRFFGFKNLSAGWRSQDSLAPSGMSGSVVDMHVALQREAHGQPTQNRVSMARFRRSQMWPTPTPAPETEPEPDTHDEKSVKSKKKKSGFAKIWHKVTGSSKNDSSNIRQVQSFDDDTPLAPPPPLSYLVDRGPGEVALAAPRHASTPSLGMSPGTAPSSPLPSPTPSGDRGNDGRGTSGVFDDQDQCDSPVEDGKTASFKNVHPVTSEPDMRQRGSWSPTLGNSNLGVTQTLPVPRSASMVREKSLPPLPGEPSPRPLLERPVTVFNYAPQSQGQVPDSNFLPPHAAFRTGEIRRQSFGGMASRPNLNLGVQTLPTNGSLTGSQRRALAPQYDEFAFSRRSLGRLAEDPPVNNTATPSKRKSRFGLSSLFGKKSNERQSVFEPLGEQEFPTLRRSGSGGEDFATIGGNATSTSRHSSGGAPGAGPRMSVTSRKALEELVAQDPEFVAYRYPSSDQRLDLLR